MELTTLHRRVLPAPAVSLLQGTARRLSLQYLKRAFHGDYCPLTMPWFQYRNGLRPIDELHRLSLHSEWKGAASLKTRARLLLRASVWPVLSAARALGLVWTYGRFVRDQHGIGLCRQFWTQIWLANRHNIPPLAYYKYRLFRSRNAARVGDFIQHHEIIRLLSRLNARQDTDGLDDKLRFYQFCIQHNLPTVPVVASFDPHRPTPWQHPEFPALPPTDLYLKPANGLCGQGVELWRYDHRNQYWCHDGRCLDALEMIRHGRDRARIAPQILQPRVCNRSDVSRFSETGLCTVRLITYRFPTQHPQVLLASLRMPIGRTDVDNFAAGGAAAGIHLTDGCLGPAMTKAPGAELHHHPDTGAAITGHRLQDWDEIVNLAVRAHACCPQFGFVGWDIGVTPEGPVLLEANTTWGVETAQIPNDRPLSDTPFVECYLAWLRDDHRPA